MGYDPIVNRRKRYSSMEFGTNWIMLKVLQNWTFSKHWTVLLNWRGKSYILIFFVWQNNFLFPWKITSLGFSIERGINIRIMAMSYKCDQKITRETMGLFVYLFLFVWEFSFIGGLFVFLFDWFFLSIKSNTLIILLNGLKLLRSYQLFLQGVMQTYFRGLAG